MTGYKKRPTQEERILSLLRERGSRGVYAWEIPTNLHILQYNARIFGLRQKGYVIENKTPGYFVLTEDIEFDNSGQRKLI